MNNIRRKSILAIFNICLITLPFSSFAAQVREMQDGDEASADISKHDINRIKIEGDRIRSVKYNSGEIEISQDESLGELYVRPSRAAENKPVNLFVITEGNFTYKLLLYPKSIPSEQILINNTSSVVLGNDNPVKSIKNSYQQQIISLIKAMKDGKSIESYQVVSSKKYIDLGDLEIKKIKTYKGENFTGEFFTLKNDTKSILNLEERMFFKSGVRAVKIENPNLLPDESTNIFIVS